MMFLAFDCEGPITLNDNAFEFCKVIIPQGDLFFTKISRFDDYLAEIKRKKGYKAGDTLKLILPFLKLFGADNERLREFSRKTLVFLPGALEFLKEFIDRPLYIVSTSYRPYLEALCEVSGFPMERVFCTEVDFSLVQISKAEREILEKLFKEIQEIPLFELPSHAKELSDLSEECLSLLDRLEEIFFEELPGFEVGRFLREVNPVGGEEKARACIQISEELGVSLKEGFYCGDSITDTKALELLRASGGISLAFNANRYALKSAEFYALSENADLLNRLSQKVLEEGKRAFDLFSEEERVGKVPEDKEAFESLVKESESFRKKVRGIQIGALG